MSDFMDYKRRHQLRKQRKLTMLRESPKDYSPYPKKSGSSMMNAPYWADMEEPQKPPVNHTRRFMLQCVVSALLVGAVYWVNTKGSQLPAIKHSIKTAMTQEFQFAAVSQWYENYLGDPISFLPNIPKDTKSANEGSSEEHQTQTDKSSFANPVTGEVKTPYKTATKGVTVETHAHTTVKAVKDGLVVFVGKKKTIGETVVIQHKDNDESWYGKLDAANVKVYQEVKKGQNIGVTSGNNKKGSFYFALKKGEKFIDPIQVMSFD